MNTNLPSPVIDVPRHEIGDTVAAMLLNPDVGDVVCREQPGGAYTITPQLKSR